MHQERNPGKATWHRRHPSCWQVARSQELVFQQCPFTSTHHAHTPREQTDQNNCDQECAGLHCGVRWMPFQTNATMCCACKMGKPQPAGTSRHFDFHVPPPRGGTKEWAWKFRLSPPPAPHAIRHGARPFVCLHGRFLFHFSTWDVRIYIYIYIFFLLGTYYVFLFAVMHGLFGLATLIEHTCVVGHIHSEASFFYAC